MVFSERRWNPVIISKGTFVPQRYENMRRQGIQVRFPCFYPASEDVTEGLIPPEEAGDAAGCIDWKMAPLVSDSSAGRGDIVSRC